MYSSLRVSVFTASLPSNEAEPHVCKSGPSYFVNGQLPAPPPINPGYRYRYTTPYNHPYNPDKYFGTKNFYHQVLQVTCGFSIFGIRNV